MVNPLYWESALVYAFVMSIILFHDIHIRQKHGERKKTFQVLLLWVVFFCLQDAFWGICGSSFIKSDRLFFAASTLFHISTVVTTFFWLHYVLTFWNIPKNKRICILFLDGIVIAFQIILLIRNIFMPTIFYIENGIYMTAALRPVAFLNQYIVYLLIGIATLVHTIRQNGDARKKSIVVLCFSAAPILSGGFQLMYPNSPFYSMGYFLGCFIIHIFIVTGEREAAIESLHQKSMEEQLIVSKTDKLTGIPNRRAYEDDIQQYLERPIEPDLIYVCADVNGLKDVNDTLGHAAGDELILGAVDCLKKCLGPYGKLYRVGGDEIVAILFADENSLEQIKTDMAAAAAAWTGKVVKSLSISTGYVSRKEYLNLSITELAKIADQRMYQSKAAYYSKEGRDRRQRPQIAFSILCASYTKILKINLTADTYQIVYMDMTEQTKEKGFADRISTWLSGFGLSGQVHEDSLEEYLQKTDITYLRDYFHGNKRTLVIFYKRRCEHGYRNAMMEMVPAEDYADDNQILYLYVKDIDK